jgi:hypothetical protein
MGSRISFTWKLHRFILPVEKQTQVRSAIICKRDRVNAGSRNREVTKRSFQVLVVFLTAVLFFLYFVGSSLKFQNWGVAGSLFQGVGRILRDPETQGTVLFCITAYSATFLLLLQRSRPQVLARWNNTTVWLIGFLGIGGIVYCMNYSIASNSCQAVTLSTGIALGLGTRLWSDWQAPRTGWPWMVPAVLISLFVAASFWQSDLGRVFYRGNVRWSGVWDNPNTFGLMMGTGVLLATGMGVRGWFGIGQIPTREVRSQISRWIAAVACSAAGFLTARGLLHSACCTVTAVARGWQRHAGLPIWRLAGLKFLDLGFDGLLSRMFPFKPKGDAETQEITLHTIRSFCGFARTAFRSPSFWSLSS